MHEPTEEPTVTHPTTNDHLADNSAAPVADSTLTRLEWKALTAHHNLADGHARQGTVGALDELVDRLPAIFRRAETTPQIDLQNDFEAVYFNAAGQLSVLSRDQTPQYHYSSSLSIEVVANHLRLEGLRVGLLHPTFDNIPDILKRHGVPLVPVTEAVFIDPGTADWDAFDALFLVVPNNPTGLDPRPEVIEEIALECSRRGVLLIVDFSFRFFSAHLDGRDLYAFLLEHDIDHIGIEDVGKLWPMLDLKIGALVSGPRRYAALGAITDDLLLNVSPFIFALIAESGRSGVLDQARAIGAANRAVLTEALAGGPVRLLKGGARMSIAWLELPAGWDGSEVCAWLHQRSIAVLPGGPFFWAAHEQGAGNLRIALMRPEKDFETGARALADAFRQYGTSEQNEAEGAMTEIESLVLEQAKAVLDDAAVDLDDDFFEVGGDSVLGMHFVGRVGRALDVPVRTTLLFGSPVLRNFAAGVAALRPAGATKTRP